MQKGTILHEIGHVLGMLHEHQRNNRDDYLTINYDSLSYWGFGMNFVKEEDDDFGMPYDYNSVMHYSPTVSTTTHTTFSLPLSLALDPNIAISSPPSTQCRRRLPSASDQY